MATKLLLVVACLLGSAAIAGAVLFGLNKYDSIKQRVLGPGKAASSAQAAQARLQRKSLAIAVAPAPLPTALPLVERPGSDRDGYPKSYVDASALRSLLHYEHYQELTSYIEQLQSSFEADHKKEMWPSQAADAFASPDPSLLPQLEAWARATPDSFAPYLGLGAHWTSVESASRGGKFARDTPTQDFEAMHESAKVARRNLTQALLKQPKLVAAQRYVMQMALLNGQHQLMERALAEATHVCPSCYLIRVSYMFGLEPRWGGSFQAMTQFANAAPVQDNPKLALLIGYVDIEKADVALRDHHDDVAMEFAEAACKLGDHADFFHERADVWLAKQDLPRARQDLDRALELRPELVGLRMARARVLVEMKDWEHAAQDLIAAVRVDPTGETARWVLYNASQGLDTDGWAAHLRGEHDRAVELLELATQLSPFNVNLRRHMEEAVRSGVTGTPEELAKLETAAKAAPDDFSRHQILDYALAKQRLYPRVIEMWTEYLARHPDDGHAFFERSGAYYNSGQRPEAAADVAKACDLGVNQACAFALKLSPRK